MKVRTFVLVALVGVSAAVWGWRTLHRPGKSDIPKLEALLAYAQERRISAYMSTDLHQSLSMTDRRYCEVDGKVCEPLGAMVFEVFDPQSQAVHAGLKQRIQELGLAVNSFGIRFEPDGAIGHAQLVVSDQYLTWFVYSPGKPWVSSHPQLAVTHLDGPWYLEEDTDWN
ncbi:hypothetical protein RAS12_04280 [Achromobacter seleniivolatilans]|uniref:Lipoprotein n=1 Tax=Achromobacter seleniivolatilans TaxID=3047478 RepID=A0ABY9M3M4_9BURK|nr:hypothetical protein [Achromobacter sp. R39]WMD21601.1 hypothetical protein RAS12_04280 [Achromobacter sp. R39]